MSDTSVPNPIVNSSSGPDSGSRNAQHDHTSVNATIHPPPLPELSRRIVTGVDLETGKSEVQIDDRGGYIHPFPDDIYRFQTVWYTPVPADCSDAKALDPMKDITKLKDIPQTGVVGNMVWTKPSASVPQHETLSLDFGIVIKGSMELIMENGDVKLLKPGYVVIQRETSHGWRNPSSTEWCKMFFVGVASTSSILDNLFPYGCYFFTNPGVLVIHVPSALHSHIWSSDILSVFDRMVIM